MYYCNHPGMEVINGCPKQYLICCKSCPEATDCELSCVEKNSDCLYPRWVDVETMKIEGEDK